MSLATKVLVGLTSGIAVGVFLGELASPLAVVGNAFVLLLQMTVLPYMVVSLVRGLGGLELSEARMLAGRAGVFLLLLWIFPILAVALVPLALPDWPSASFFSNALVQERVPFDFLSLFIPSNPFNALADNVVPAVVVFSVAFGVALIGLDGKAELLRVFDSAYQALSRITEFVIRLAPYGVFAIGANAAGTLDLEAIRGLQVYVMIHASLVLLIALWAAPMLVVTLTPLRYRDVFGATRSAFITAFATGNLFVVLSVLTDQTKQILRAHEDGDENSMGPLVGVIVPSSFNFPSSGKLMALCFVPFAGWLSGFKIDFGEMPPYLATGVVSFFGSTIVAIPFLLDLFRIPSDLFDLFIVVDNVVGNRFGALLAAVHTVCLAILSACAMTGRIEISGPRIARFVVITLGLFLAVVLGIRGAFGAIGHTYEKYALFIDRGLQTTSERADAPEGPALPESADDDAALLDRIRGRGKLRVGYAADALPYVFRNNKAELVGFDVDMANTLAAELGVKAVFYKLDRSDLWNALNDRRVDIVMTGVPVSTEDLARVSFSRPVLDETLAFSVRDYQRSAFSSVDSIRELEAPRIVVPRLQYYREKVTEMFPNAEPIELGNVREFFRQEGDEYDALVTTAERGSAWSLIYPQFTVAVPMPSQVLVPIAYAVPRGSEEMVNLLNAWLDLKRKDGTIEHLFDYWMRGIDDDAVVRRWSVIRDVLGWVD